jgi:uncharacterized OB-fold protein
MFLDTVGKSDDFSELKDRLAGRLCFRCGHVGASGQSKCETAGKL